MQTPNFSRPRGRVLLLEPNAALRSAITTILTAEHYQVERVDALEDMLGPAGELENSVALVAWQSMQGLLSDERRPELADLTRHLRLVLMVPRHWSRLLENTEVPKLVAALIAKPFQAEELLSALDRAYAAAPERETVTS
jgi:CheY-like chemotaxis protein